MVGVRAEELREQVDVRAVQLDAVEAGALEVLGCVCEAADRLVDVVLRGGLESGGCRRCIGDFSRGGSELWESQSDEGHPLRRPAYLFPNMTGRDDLLCDVLGARVPRVADLSDHE